MTLFAKTKSFDTKSSPTWPPLSTGYSGVCGAALWLCAGGRGRKLHACCTVRDITLQKGIKLIVLELIGKIL